MSRSRKAGPDASFDPDLADLPEPMRWREWMGHVEAATFLRARPGATGNARAYAGIVARAALSRPQQIEARSAQRAQGERPGSGYVEPQSGNAIGEGPAHCQHSE